MSEVEAEQTRPEKSVARFAFPQHVPPESGCEARDVAALPAQRHGPPIHEAMMLNRRSFFAAVPAAVVAMPAIAKAMAESAPIVAQSTVIEFPIPVVAEQNYLHMQRMINLRWSERLGSSWRDPRTVRLASAELGNETA